MKNTNLIDLIFGKGLKIAFLIFLAFVLYEIIKYFVKHSIIQYIERRYRDLDKESAEKRKKTLERVFLSTIKALFLFFISVIILFEIGVLKIAPLAALAGFFGLAFGFGGQNLARDIINGFFIITEDHFKKGDYIKIDNNIEGIVEDINLRRVVLKDISGKLFYIPNGEIKISSNITKSRINLDFDIIVPQKENIDFIIELLNGVGREMIHDQNFEKFLVSQIKVKGIKDISKNGITINLSGEINENKRAEVLNEYYYRLKKNFEKLNIELK